MMTDTTQQDRATAAAGAKAGSNPDVRAALQPFVDRGAMAGAVALVADHERILSIDPVGWANIETQTPMHPDTIGWVASQTKPVTGAAVMALVGDGILSLDDTVEKHLPKFADLWLAAYRDEATVLLKRPSRPITVRDVMCHISGMPFLSGLEWPALDALPLKVAVDSYAITPLMSEPGTKYSYSNAGVNTAGRIVELLSGMLYEEFLDQRFFRPLGMVDTTFFPTEEQVARIATPYGTDETRTKLRPTQIDQLTYPLTGPGRYPMPAGGLFSTAIDMAIFCQMVLGGGTFNGVTCLTPDAVHVMTSRQTPEDMMECYGVGWDATPGRKGHGGAYASTMEVYTEKDRILVWLPQSAGFPLDGGDAFAAFRDTIIGK